VEQIAVSLLLWIAANSPYAVSQLAPPPILTMTPQAITAAAIGDSPDAQQQKVDSRIYGFFDAQAGPRGTIFLVRPEDTPGAGQFATPSDNPVFRERMLHELVHFAQEQTGVAAQFRCPSQGEVMAYRLGGMYLAELGVPDPLRNRRLMAAMHVRC
jgi:hypothetical protein